MRQYLLSLAHRSAPATYLRLRSFFSIALEARVMAVRGLCILMIAICVEHAMANVGPANDVWLLPVGATNPIPANDPFDLNPELSVGGNRIDGNLLPTDKQITFEGIININNPADPTDDTNENVGVIVGRTSTGSLLIDGGSALRDEDLIIGGSALVGGPGGQIRRGTGTVIITGPGSLYNNDPTIFPPLADSNGNPIDGSTISKVPRDPVGKFNLFVGEAGAGTLDISAGGSAEIQNSIVVGDQSGSTGAILVDGLGSFLANTGQLPQSADPSIPGIMVIGRRGSGQMTVTNGAQVVANGPTAANGVTTIAACIGSDPTTANFPLTQAGGRGSVTIDGFGSTWAVQGGGLQVGGFDSMGIGTGAANADVAGNNLLQNNQSTNYVSNVGQGTLNVSNGAIVTINANSAANAPPPSLDMLVGQYGTVNMSGGSIEVNDQLTSDPTNAQRNIVNVRLINDGVISGSGSITTGQFDNRALGRVRIGVGEKLLVNATGRAMPADLALPFREPMQNFGLIEVLGTDLARAEVEFQRSSPALAAGNTDLPRPFFNFQQPTPTANGGRQFGQITAQSATLRFDSGLQNQSFLAFTGGTNIATGPILNCAAGDTVNCSAPLIAGGAVGLGQISISGNGTSVTFEDTVTNNGVFSIGGINTTVTFKDPPTNNGKLEILSPTANVTIVGNLTLGSLAGPPPVPSELDIALGANVNVTGNLIFNGSVVISPILGSLNNLAVGQLFTLLTYGGSLLPPGTSFTTTNTDLGNGLILIPVDPLQTPNYIEVKVCSSMTGCTAGGMLPPPGNADLDGNGVVDATDLAIWRSRFGLSGLGDVNGDGIVDAADFTIIRAHFGLSMGTGAGTGSGVGAAVPEPTSLALLVSGGLLALAFRRRQKMR